MAWERAGVARGLELLTPSHGPSWTVGSFLLPGVLSVGVHICRDHAQEDHLHVAERRQDIWWAEIPPRLLCPPPPPGLCKKQRGDSCWGEKG